MNLILRKCDWMDDWYVIERAEHDGHEWVEKVGENAFSYRTSARFSDADIEGTADEMLAIADAIERRSEASFKRCEVLIKGDVASFCSPRNSQVDGECSLAEADALAAEIREKLSAASSGLAGQRSAALDNWRRMRRSMGTGTKPPAPSADTLPPLPPQSPHPAAPDVPGTPQEP